MAGTEAWIKEGLSGGSGALSYQQQIDNLRDGGAFAKTGAMGSIGGLNISINTTMSLALYIDNVDNDINTASSNPIGNVFTFTTAGPSYSIPIASYERAFGWFFITYEQGTNTLKIYKQDGSAVHSTLNPTNALGALSNLTNNFENGYIRKAYVWNNQLFTNTEFQNIYLNNGLIDRNLFIGVKAPIARYEPFSIAYNGTSSIWYDTSGNGNNAIILALMVLPQPWISELKANNVGTVGEGIFKDVTNKTFNFRKIVDGGGINVSTNGDNIELENGHQTIQSMTDTFFGALVANDLIQWDGTAWANIQPSTLPISTATQTALNGKEDSSNKSTSIADSASTTKFPVWSVIVSYFDINRIKSILGITVLSGSNTGDETTASIQSKRPLKTIEGQSLEGTGNIDLTKNDVGLSNVDNTSDLNKPISTATQTALNGKVNIPLYVTATTTTSVVTTLISIPITLNTSKSVQYHLKGRNPANGNTFAAQCFFAFKNVGGVVSLVGTLSIDRKSDFANGVQTTVTFSAGNANINITAQNGVTTNWELYVEKIY